ncbi:hypothetical protein EJP77_10230 [Paenibacillus zeisoli]|uniref:Glycosyltransferase n=1 Tax=Paenibacillus zeisoli TaxID=2496267 RepID=A0A3S1B5W7_9BACL|nr:hypothetical protein [Paenibacillus zeisoli]RUT31755.1 hypothetical protein EJP77_10230 [Paenibacillus zeisoli]
MNHSAPIQQQIYTRARRGIFRQTEGFDTVAKSAGLEASFIKKVLHPFCVYDAPAELTARGERDNAAYPGAVHLFHTENGDTVLGRSIYQAADFTGLRSAFFTHNYVIPASRSEELVRNYRSYLHANFQDSYDMEQGGQLPVLDQLPVDRASLDSGRVNPVQLLEELHIPETMFKQLLSAVMSSAVSGRKVYVALDVPASYVSEAAVPLLELVYAALPYSYRRKLGFLTYAKEPQSRKGIHISFVERGSLRHGDRSIEKDYTFDLASGRVTNVELDWTKQPFLDLVWSRIGRLDQLEDFHRFADIMLKDMGPEKAMSISSYHELSVLYQIEGGNEALYEDHKIAVLSGMLEYLRPAGALPAKERLNDLFLARFDLEFDIVKSGMVPELAVAECIKDYYRIDSKNNERKIVEYFIRAAVNAVKNKSAFAGIYALIENHPSLCKAYFDQVLKDDQLTSLLYDPYMEGRLHAAEGAREVVSLVQEWDRLYPGIWDKSALKELARSELTRKLKAQQNLAAAVNEVLLMLGAHREPASEAGRYEEWREQKRQLKMKQQGGEPASLAGQDSDPWSTKKRPSRQQVKQAEDTREAWDTRQAEDAKESWGTGRAENTRETRSTREAQGAKDTMALFGQGESGKSAGAEGQLGFGATGIYAVLDEAARRVLLIELDLDKITKKELLSLNWLAETGRDYGSQRLDGRLKSKLAMLQSLFAWFSETEPDVHVFDGLKPAEMDQVQQAGRRWLKDEVNADRFDRLTLVYYRGGADDSLDYAPLVDALRNYAGSPGAVYRFFHWSAGQPLYLRGSKLAPAYEAAILAYFRKHDRDAFRKRANWKEYFDKASRTLKPVYEKASQELASPLARMFGRGRKPILFSVLFLLLLAAGTLGILQLSGAFDKKVPAAVVPPVVDKPEVTEPAPVVPTPDRAVYAEQVKDENGKEVTRLVFLFKTSAECEAFRAKSVTVTTPEAKSQELKLSNLTHECSSGSSAADGEADAETTDRANPANMGIGSSKEAGTASVSADGKDTGKAAGTADGTTDDIVNGTAAGKDDGNDGGASDGTVSGTASGGTANGTTHGNADGTINGSTHGTSDKTTSGASNINADDSSEAVSGGAAKEQSKTDAQNADNESENAPVINPAAYPNKLTAMLAKAYSIPPGSRISAADLEFIYFTKPTANSEK